MRSLRLINSSSPRPRTHVWKMPYSSAPLPWTGYCESGKPRRLINWSCAGFPKTPRVHAFSLRLAKIQLELNKFASAEKTFDSLFQGHPGEKKRTDLRLAQAASLFAQKKYLKAGAAFEAVLGMRLSNSQRISAERGLASSWWRAGEFAKAAPAYQRLIRNPAKGWRLPLVFLAKRGKKQGFCVERGRKYLVFVLDVIGKGAPFPSSSRFQMADCLFNAGLKKRR